MKRIIALLLCMAMLCGMTACGKESADNSSKADTPAAKETLNVAVLKGPTALGMLPLMSKNEAGASAVDYHFTVAGAADEITAAIIKGDIPVAAVPCNLAATLYNKTKGGVKVAAINTLGVLYILDTGDSVQSVADLKGKTIYSTGAGTTPEYTLRHLLSSNGIDPDKDVSVVMLSEASEVASKMAAADEEIIAMLPMPYVISVQQQNPNTRIAIDVTKEWETVNGSTVVTGVLVVNTDFYNKNPKLVQTFLAEYEKSTASASSQVDATAELAEHFDIFKAAVAKKAIPYCNIVYRAGDAMKSDVAAYLKVLFDSNPASVGGAMPNDDFYLVP